MEFATKQLVIGEDLVKCQVCRTARSGTHFREPTLLLDAPAGGLPVQLATCEAVFGFVAPNLRHAPQIWDTAGQERYRAITNGEAGPAQHTPCRLALLLPDALAAVPRCPPARLHMCL